MVIVAIIALLSIGLFSTIFLLWKKTNIVAEVTRREQQLQNSNSVLNKLFSIIGHDLKGYIGSMPMALELFKSGETTKSEKEFLICQLEQTAIASYEVLQNLLSWGEYQLQGGLLKQDYINVEESVLETLRLMGILAETKGITITSNVSKKMFVYADLNHFRFIMRNLLSNAVKYSKNGGLIEIKAKRSDDNSHIIFSVKDDGIGLGAEKKAEIFDSFGVSTPGTANEKGHGIGLRLCKEFVVANGGIIWVESEANKGAVFYFSMKAEK